MSAGPFRFNFSKSGVGVSVGVKGLRIGTGPRGHYIHAGRGGLYYRATLGQAGAASAREPSPPEPSSEPGTTITSDGVVMIEVESGDVMHMCDSSFSDLLDEVNSKAKQTRMSAALPITTLVAAGLAAFAIGAQGLLLSAVALPAWLIGKWLDSYRRSTVIFYELEGDAETAYQRLIQGFDRLMECAGKWHIKSGGAIRDITTWKRNAGASHIVDKKPTNLIYSLPAVIKSNITPPAIHVGNKIMYFLPDTVLIQDGSRIGAVSYKDLGIRHQYSRFIEEGRVPSDAKIVSYTWKHPNKDGGPDRRFSVNKQIPVCLYEVMHFSSSSGVNELVEFSKVGAVEAFVEGFHAVGALPKERPRAIAPSAASDSATGARSPIGKTEPGQIATPWAGLAAVLGVSATLAITYGHPGKSPSQGAQASAEASKSTPPGASQMASEKKLSTSTPQVSQPDSSEASKPSLKPMDLVEPPPRNTKSAANLREGPGSNFPVITVVPKGAPVLIKETKGGWSRVQVRDSVQGWMANSVMEGN